MTELPSDERWFWNVRDPDWSTAPVPRAVRAFHESLPGYAPTTLVEVPAIAAQLGVRRAFAKDESNRLGLPAFKALGASWAIHRALQERGAGAPVTFVTATDGNHGRAVARFARLLGHRSAIVVPEGVHEAAIEAIEQEGASVIRVPGSYDDAVRAARTLAVGGTRERGRDAARDADGRSGDGVRLLVQDTAWPGYEQVPGWIVEGYATLFAELDDQLAALGERPPGLVVVPVGVGSLAQAAVRHYRSGGDAARTRLVAVEPVAAACVLASLRAHEPVTVPTSVTTMAGLNCGTPSSLAWPSLRDGLDAAVAVTDDEARVAGQALRMAGVDAGPCGAASLAGALAALGGPDGAGRRASLGVGAGSTVVLVITEGTAANPA